MYMKNKLVLLLFFILTGAVSVNAQNLPDQKETLEVMKKVNGYFMKKYADYTIPSFYGRVRPSNIWTRGVYYEGLLVEDHDRRSPFYQMWMIKNPLWHRTSQEVKVE